MKLSPWIIVHEYCATRVLFGTDPNDVKNRVAFIEKTPRVRLKSWQCAPEMIRRNVSSCTGTETDYWLYGSKGSGGSGDHEAQGNYGFHQPAREWCDAVLRLLGYEFE